MSSNFRISVEIDARGATAAANQIGKADAAMNNFGASAKASGTAFQTIFAGNVAASVIATTTSALVAGASAVLDYSAKLEQTKVSFDTLTGSAEKSTAFLQQIQNFAKSTPFEFADVAGFSQKLLAANVELDKTLPLLRDIGNAVSAVGGGREEIEGTVRAITQIISKGKVSAEEINQLAERNINGFKILASELGKTESQVRKLAEAGEISSDTFVKAFQKYSQANFGDAMEKQSKTFTGAMSNIKDSVQISASTAFAPLFDKVRVLAVDLAKEIEAQNGDFEKIGGVIFEYIGIGFVAAVEAAGGALVSYTARRFKELASEGKVLTSVGEGFLRGIEEGVGKASRSLTDAVGATQPKIKLEFSTGGIKYGFDEVNNVIKQTASSVSAVKKPLNEYEKALIGVKARWKEALEEANEDKLKQQKELIRDTAKLVADLGFQVTYFGDETEVTAVKQQLLNKGITDFDSGLAKSAVSLARQLDGLKATKKEQEDLKNKTKSFYDELGRASETALDSVFPQTELDRFDRWLDGATRGMESLKAEAAGVREQLRAAAGFKALFAGYEIAGNFDKALDTAITAQAFANLEEGIAPVNEQLLQMVSALNLAQSSIIKLDNTTFVHFTEGAFVQKGAEFLKKWTAEVDKYKAQIKDINDQVSKVGRTDSLNFYEQILGANHEQRLADIKKPFVDFLRDLKTTVIVEGKPVEQPLFIDEGAINQFIRKYQLLNDILGDTSAKKAVAELEDVVGKLGIRLTTLGGAAFGAQTEMERFDQWLASDSISKSLETVAASAGITSAALKDVIRQAKLAEQAKATRPRIAETEAKPIGKLDSFRDGFSSGLFGTDGAAKIQSEAEIVKAAYKDIGETAGSVVASMAEGVGALVEQWVLYGDAGPDALKKMTAQVLASVSAEAAVKAIFQLAEGFAALFINPGQAAAHFKAAALYGAVAVTAGVAGRAIAGDSFRNEGGNGQVKDQSDQPDYRTAGNSNLSNIRTGSNISADSQTRRLIEKIEMLGGAVEAVSNKMKAMKAGDVLTIGADQKPGFFASQTTKDLKKNSSAQKEMGGALNL